MRVIPLLFQFRADLRLVVGYVPCEIYAAQDSAWQHPLFRVKASAKLISLGDIRLVREVDRIDPTGSAGNLSRFPKIVLT